MLHDVTGAKLRFTGGKRGIENAAILGRLGQVDLGSAICWRVVEEASALVAGDFRLGKGMYRRQLGAKHLVALFQMNEHQSLKPWDAASCGRSAVRQGETPCQPTPRIIALLQTER